MAVDYVATFNREHERWNVYPDAVRRSVEVFNLLDVRPMRALLLSLTAKFATGQVAPAFEFLISLGVRLLIASSTRSGSVENPLATAANKVFRGEITTTAELKRSLTGATPTNEEFRQAFQAARVSKARLARYYLRSLEMVASNESEPWFVPVQDTLIVNLEHVLPKKPEGNWPQFTDDEAAMYINRLGNQVLMRAGDNSNLRSASFAAKRPIYSQSPYKLTSEVGQKSNWCPPAITDRQSRLAELACQAWPV